MTTSLSSPISSIEVSTHMPLARHDFDWRAIGICVFVSTHMPLARHDRVSGKDALYLESFYSHTSCEAWPKKCVLLIYSVPFLLTCLLRGMTSTQTRRVVCISVSTHLPLARHDHALNVHILQRRGFLLTCLLRGMTSIGVQLVFAYSFLLTCLLRGMTQWLI